MYCQTLVDYVNVLDTQTKVSWKNG